MSSIFLGGSAPAPLIEIRRDGKSMVTVHPDGRVEYHGEYAPDEAARAFWEALSTFCPTRQYAEALAALSAEKEKRQAAQGGVTEAMVDTAVEAFDDLYDGVSHNKREAIRHALEAALAPFTTGAGHE
jgi:hypothetical protein